MTFMGPPPIAFDDDAPLSASPAGRLRMRTRRTFLLIAALVFGLFGLAALLQVGGAVIGTGEIAVQSRVKVIVHPTGGVLEGVYVHEGDKVKLGQVLMRFDTSVSSIGASQARASVDELLARRARLEAERDGAAGIVFPAELAAGSDPTAQALIARERRLFELKRHERAGTRALLGERVRQAEEQIHSYQAQIAASHGETRLIEPELAGVRDLYNRKLVTITRRNQLERTAVELAGSRAALSANIAQSRANISEVREQMLNVDQTARADAATELAQVMTQINDQMVRRASANDTFDRSVIRAPQAGVIDKIAFNTIGSAVPAGQPILQIVPDTDRMIVEARISRADVDQLRVGQKARISFSSLNRQVTPDASGVVSFVAVEPTEDSRTGQSYYRIRVNLERGVAREVKVQLVSGMPVEVFVETGTRSILSYLLKPLNDQLSHAMRED